MADKEVLNYNYLEGYYNSDEVVEVPEGAMIVPSVNVLYSRKGKPTSLKEFETKGNFGGTRAFVLDNEVVGFLGVDNSGSAGRGNMFQGVGKNLWFVGNTLPNGVTAYSAFPNSPTQMQIGGVAQVYVAQVTAEPTADGTASFEFVSANLTSSPITINVDLLGADGVDEAAAKIASELRGNSDIYGSFYIKAIDDLIYVTDKTIRTDDGTLTLHLLSEGGTSLAVYNYSSIAGSIDYAADLSSIPQFAKWNGTGWNNPVQVGMAAQEDAPQLALTTDTTRDAYFSGIITGSTSARLARKRGGTISIASGASNVVTGDTDSVYVYVPDYPEDGSDLDDQTWILYFTYRGKGSLLAHFEFPIEIPEAVLNGAEDLGWSATKGNARVKVISQHDSDISQRILEIEFNDNDLLQIEPFDEYFAAEATKFIYPLGNVMCEIGVGSESTAFDVSWPNFREAYNTDWRDWFSEVPVSVAPASEYGMLWIATANTVYQAVWSGAEAETAPVILRQVSSKYGSIGEQAAVAVNGVLYLLSKGKTPVRISSNGEIDLEFGKKVMNVFSSFSSNTIVSYDEETNSVLFIDGQTAIAWQIDNQRWGAILNFHSVNIETAVSIGGHLFGCKYDGGFITQQYNAVEGNLSWKAVSSFQTGKSWLALKDIIEGQIVSEAISAPYSISVSALKNYHTDSSASLFTESPIDVGVNISTRKLLERLDYQSIGILASGTGGGQSVHAITIVVDIHEIERQ